mgnify:FL=1
MRCKTVAASTASQSQTEIKIEIVKAIWIKRCSQTRERAIVVINRSVMGHFSFRGFFIESNFVSGIVEFQVYVDDHLQVIEATVEICQRFMYIMSSHDSNSISKTRLIHKGCSRNLKFPIFWSVLR